jgi:hypothetical protein
MPMRNIRKTQKGVKHKTCKTHKTYKSKLFNGGGSFTNNSVHIKYSKGFFGTNSHEPLKIMKTNNTIKVKILHNKPKITLNMREPNVKYLVVLSGKFNDKKMGKIVDIVNWVAIIDENNKQNTILKYSFNNSNGVNDHILEIYKIPQTFTININSNDKREYIYNYLYSGSVDKGEKVYEKKFKIDHGVFKYKLDKLNIGQSLIDLSLLY